MSGGRIPYEKQRDPNIIDTIFEEIGPYEGNEEQYRLISPLKSE